jgi:hypothetical protein
MQTLGLSDSTPHTESRLKSLFWPSIKTGSDVDYLGTQGYWVCAVVAVLSFVFLAVSGNPFIGAVIFLFNYLGGIGVRERSRYAAIVVLVAYALNTLVAGIGVVRVIILALLLSNMRATWIASGWKPESEEATAPPRLRETWGDKVADQFPLWLWPKARFTYYLFSAGFLILEVRGALIVLGRLGVSKP